MVFKENTKSLSEGWQSMNVYMKEENVTPNIKETNVRKDGLDYGKWKKNNEKSW